MACHKNKIRAHFNVTGEQNSILVSLSLNAVCLTLMPISLVIIQSAESLILNVLFEIHPSRSLSYYALACGANMAFILSAFYSNIYIYKSHFQPGIPCTMKPSYSSSSSSSSSLTSFESQAKTQRKVMLKEERSMVRDIFD